MLAPAVYAGFMDMPAVGDRVAALPWESMEATLWEQGHAPTPRLLDPSECAVLAELYPHSELFRSRIDMARYRFGSGEYQYFADPLPDLVAALRREFYPRLVLVANRWMEALGLETRFPGTLEELRAFCHARGQSRPTPLMLSYGAGDYNCLHQDLNGDVFFPFQVVISLREPGRDFTGGHFLLVEQRPRAQSVGYVQTPRLGEAVIFTTRYRPVQGRKGFYRGNVKHGVSPVLSGARLTLGIIFHDAA